MLGKGFILSPDQAQELIQQDSRNKDVLFPYLNGEDLNSRPDCSASRWVINFHDWSEERAREYPQVFEIVERNVKPERLKNNRKVYRDYWWQYAEKRPAMLRALRNLDRVLVVARVSKTGLPVFVTSKQVMSEQTVVFTTQAAADFATLSSGIHQAWTIAQASTLETRVRDTPSDVYDTMPLPLPTPRMEETGSALSMKRKEIMLLRQIGVTKLYNLIHDVGNGDADIVKLRQMHVAVDEAVLDAYNWGDLSLKHGFHLSRQGNQFGIAPMVRGEILDRLLELNHAQYRIDAGRAGLATGARRVLEDPDATLF
ncbi:type IIL restriction-modification enzyme MmeI [Streptomyces sp. TR06-5]|uniref:type IIL restriction-modification enzyme MmeI n=1 Tax=Streptomyces sp. TR06-5 TaxID=3385976 RepID=UPI0039A1F75B